MEVEILWFVVVIVLEIEYIFVVDFYTTGVNAQSWSYVQCYVARLTH